jgi:hypothetical protein
MPPRIADAREGIEPSLSLNRPAPPQLTAGLPDPSEIDTQRSAYMKSLDEQLKQGAEVLNQQLKQQQDYLLKMGDQQKRQFGLQVDQNNKNRELELVQQHNHQLLMLQQAAQQQKVALEQQANALLIEYNQKKATEDLASQMYQFENDAHDAHAKYETEIKSLQQQQMIGAQQLAAQGEALARQANMSNMQAIAAQQVAARTSASLTTPMPSVPTLSAAPSLSYLPVSSYAQPPSPRSSYVQPLRPSSGVPTMPSFPRSTSGRTMPGTGLGAPLPTGVQQGVSLTPRMTSQPSIFPPTMTSFPATVLG